MPNLLKRSDSIYTNFTLLRTLMMSSLLCICVSLAHAINIDSLKYELADTHLDSIKCPLAFSLFEYYKEEQTIDSIRGYAEQVMKCCPATTPQGLDKIAILIYKLSQSNQTHFIDSLIQAYTPNLDDKLDRVLYYTTLSERIYIAGNPTHADIYLDKAKASLPSSDQNSSKAYYYNLLGYYHMNEGNNLTAIQSYELGLTYTDTLSSIYYRYSIDLGVAYNKIGEYEKAIKLFTRNIEIATQRKYNRIRNYSYYGLLSSYSQMEDYETTIQLCHEAISRNSSADSTELGFLYYTLGYAQLSHSKLDSAIHSFTTGLELSIKKNDTKGIHDNYLGIADYHSKVGNFDLAEQHYIKAKNIGSYVPDTDLEKRLAHVYAEQKDYKNAYLSLNKFNESTDRTQANNQSDLQLAVQLIEEANTYKEATTKEILNRKHEKKRLQQILIVSLCLILLISTLLYYIQQNKKTLSSLNKTISIQNKELKTALNNQDESIKLLENFASVAAHDLKAPIRTASSFAHLLTTTSKEKFSDKELEYLNFINTGTHQLSVMIDDLLNLSKLGTNLPQAESIDLNHIIHIVKTLITTQIDESNATITINKELPRVLGHQSLLIQLFQNLIKNSIDHNKTIHISRIEIDYEHQETGELKIMVSDNAGGIPDYIQPRLFDLFSSSDKNSGNGIGLAICKKIVTHYGGDIWVTVQENKGSTFHFTLPTWVD